ncbi:MAG: hypothetical protein WEA61_09155 [Anaerolineales bacterium]
MTAQPTPQPTSSRRLRKRIGLGIALFGLVVFLLGAKPDWFGMDRSPVVGFIQIEVFMVGLGLVALGGYFTMEAMWRGQAKPVVTELGSRLVGTGYVISLASGMADVFGLGTRPLPSVPFFGYWQGTGVLAGQVVMIIGFVMMSPVWANVELKWPKIKGPKKK